MTLAGDETATEFISGANGARPSQLDRAVSAIVQYQQTGHPVMAATLSLGGKEFEELRRSCQSACDAPFSQFLARFGEQMGVVYARLNQVLSAPAPILQATYYESSACSGSAAPAPAGIDIAAFNAQIAKAAADNEGFAVDISRAVAAGGCGPDGHPNADGQAAIQAQYRAAYETLPASYVDPFLAKPTP